MNNLTPTEQYRYNVLQKKKLQESSDGEHLSESETEEFKSLTERIKPSSVKIEADAQLTPDEQVRYKDLQTKVTAALNETGPPLSKVEREDYNKLYKINKKKDDGGYGGRRSQKRPTARRLRRRSSKSRKARKARATRRR